MSRSSGCQALYVQQKLCFFAGLPQNLRGEIFTAFLQPLPHVRHEDQIAGA